MFNLVKATDGPPVGTDIKDLAPLRGKITGRFASKQA